MTLADEYDAAQERGEVATATDGKLGRSQPERLKPTASDLGLSRKDIHEARIIRDAEKEDPGIVKRVLRSADWIMLALVVGLICFAIGCSFPVGAV